MNNKSSLFLLMSSLYKKLPNWVKLIFKFLFLSIIILKLLGFSSIFEFLSNIYYLKMSVYVTCTLATLYQLFDVFMLYLIYNKKIKISEVLP